MKNKFDVAVVIVRSNQEPQKFLLICHEGIEEHDYWVFPNDIILPRHNAQDAAVKLVLAQTDVRCRVRKEIASHMHPNGTTWHFILAEQIYGRPRPLHDTIKEIRWCNKEEIRDLLDINFPEEIWQLLE